MWDRFAEDWRVSERISEQSLSTLEEALILGNSLVGERLSVIVRPSYNEKDASGKFFREWRSFNGEPFKECRWNF
jgi:hypothetical protein